MLKIMYLHKLKNVFRLIDFQKKKIKKINTCSFVNGNSIFFQNQIKNKCSRIINNWIKCLATIGTFSIKL